jgi:hypothetical protein
MIGRSYILAKKLKQGKFYKNTAKFAGGFMVHKKIPSIDQKLTVNDYTYLFDKDLAFIIEDLGEQSSIASKHKYFTYKILTKDCVGYIFVFSNTLCNWAEVTE